MARRTSIYIPPELFERLDRLRNDINVSSVCQAALLAEVERVERSKRRAEFEQRGREYLVSNPFAIGVLQVEGAMKAAAKTFTTMSAITAGFTTTEMTGAFEGWQKAHQAVLEVLRTFEKPLLPMNFEDATEQPAER